MDIYNRIYNRPFSGLPLKPIGKTREENQAEGGRFELPDPCGSPIFKTGGFNHSPTPPCERRQDAQSLFG
jgi:hypothetical protein